MNYFYFCCIKHLHFIETKFLVDLLAISYQSLRVIHVNQLENVAEHINMFNLFIFCIHVTI